MCVGIQKYASCAWVGGRRYRQLALEQGVLLPLLANVSAAPDLPALQTVLWCLANLCRSPPGRDDETETP